MALIFRLVDVPSKLGPPPLAMTLTYRPLPNHNVHKNRCGLAARRLNCEAALSLFWIHGPSSQMLQLQQL